MVDDLQDVPRFFPVALNVRKKKCVVIGGGGIGTHKALKLGRAGAHVTVVSPVVTDKLAEQIEVGSITWLRESFQEDHLQGAFLVVVATDDDSLNASVAHIAAKCGALVCDASSAERSEVIFGALLQREDVTVAVFTDGRNPSLARQTRDQIAKVIDRTSEEGE